MIIVDFNFLALSASVIAAGIYVYQSGKWYLKISELKNENTALKGEIALLTQNQPYDLDNEMNKLLMRHKFRVKNDQTCLAQCLGSCTKQIAYLTVNFSEKTRAEFIADMCRGISFVYTQIDERKKTEQKAAEKC